MKQTDVLDVEKLLTTDRLIPAFLLPKEQWGLVISLSVFFIVASFYNYLLFHTLVEFVAIMIATFLSVVVWQTYSFTRNNFLMYLGLGYIWVAIFDLLHVLVYKGMFIFSITDANPATQFWLSARYFEAILLFTAPFFLLYHLDETGLLIFLQLLVLLFLPLL